MIAVVTDNESLSSFCVKACEELGFLTVLLPITQNPRKVQIEYISAAIVSVESDRALASKLCRSIKRIKPDIQILSVVYPSEESSSKYLDVPGSTCQMYLPCTSNDLSEKLQKICDSEFDICDLSFVKGKRQIIYRGFPLRLSKKEYTIMRYISICSPCAVKEKLLCSLCDNISTKCLAVHVCNINRKADCICSCRLISHANGGYILNRHE